MRRRDQAAIDALSEHRRREDDAPRLHTEVPNLLTLRVKLEDIREEGRVVAATYTRPIVVSSAPAYFEIRCMEARCDGRHDLTRAIVAALKAGQPSFTGRNQCPGMVADVPCERTLAYTCDATYRA
jgi:hypothetical protein